MALLTMIKSAAFAVKDFTIQHSPEILLGTSIAAGIGATVTGCIATKKMEAINAKHKDILAMLHVEGDAFRDGDGEGVRYKETSDYKRALTPILSYGEGSRGLSV